MPGFSVVEGEESRQTKGVGKGSRQREPVKRAGKESQAHFSAEK